MKKKFQWWQVPAPLDNNNDTDYRWCEETFGAPDYTSRWWFESSTQKYYFREKKDAMWFELMWSGHAGIQE
jgi:hypothetical protein